MKLIRFGLAALAFSSRSEKDSNNGENKSNAPASEKLISEETAPPATPQLSRKKMKKERYEALAAWKKAQAAREAAETVHTGVRTRATGRAVARAQNEVHKTRVALDKVDAKYLAAKGLLLDNISAAREAAETAHTGGRTKATGRAMARAQNEVYKAKDAYDAAFMKHLAVVDEVNETSAALEEAQAASEAAVTAARTNTTEKAVAAVAQAQNEVYKAQDAMRAAFMKHSAVVDEVNETSAAFKEAQAAQEAAETVHTGGRTRATGKAVARAQNEQDDTSYEVIDRRARRMVL
jgi:hypothetical protein